MQNERATRIWRSRAPLRIDLAGGWTDVPPFSAEVGGAVVNAAINRYAYATVRLRDDGRIRIDSADYHLAVEVPSFDHLVYDGQLDLVKAAIRRLNVQQGLELFVRSDAPPGSGTGSSAAVGVAILGLLTQFQSTRLSAHEIAALANRLEIEELHNAGGKQDQYAAALGGICFMEFADPCVAASRLDLPANIVAELEKHLILCYTGKSRISGNIIERVMGAYQQGVSATVRALHRLKAIAHEMKVALLTGDMAAFSMLLQENWENQKCLDPAVTNPDIDALFDLALAHGAAGGKATGAGGGGCVLFCSKPDQEHALRRVLLSRGIELLDFSFDFRGLQTWRAS